MSEKEELLYGLKVWLIKPSIYLSNYSLNELLDDELVLDAISFCIYMIDELVTNLVKKYPEIKEEYKNIDFSFLMNIKNECFKDDLINTNRIYDLSKNILKEMGNKLIF